MKYSLRNYLLISILLTMITVGGVTIWGGYRASVHEVEELFDAQLSRSARLIMGLVIAEVNLGHIKEFTEGVNENRLLMDKKNIERELYQQGHFYELKIAHQVWDSYGNMLIRSVNAPLQPMSYLEHGYANKTFKGNNWRTFTLWDSRHEYQIITAEQDDVRNDLINKITRQMTWPFLLLLPMLGGLVFYFVSKGLKPLEQIASDISTRKSEQLHALKFERIPVEIQPLVDELNHLFTSLRLSFDKEREFTSDAAHELRTPLAALKVHLQLLESSDNAKDKKNALLAISQGVERASHLVDQLLGLARLDPQAIRATQKMERLNVHEMCVNLISEIYPIANEKHQEISLQGDETVFMQAYSYAFEAMLNNLLRNAVTYAPVGGEIIVELKNTKESIEIYIDDSGPGIPQAQRQDVMQRFKKVQGDLHTGTGSGIGLSIVKRVADLHCLELSLLDSSSLGGLSVRIKQSNKT